MKHSFLRGGIVFVMLAWLSACSTGPGVRDILESEDYQPNLPDAKWEQLKGGLPRIPTFEQSTEIEPITARTTFRYAVDPESLAIARGRVVRYTLVSVSDMGATTVSYESLRCGTKEMRVIAFARSGGTWVQASSDDWRPIYSSGATAVQHLLFNGVLCSGGGQGDDNVPGLQNRLKYWKKNALGYQGVN